MYWPWNKGRLSYFQQLPCVRRPKRVWNSEIKLTHRYSKCLQRWDHERWQRLPIRPMGEKGRFPSEERTACINHRRSGSSTDFNSVGLGRGLGDCVSSKLRGCWAHTHTLNNKEVKPRVREPYGGNKEATERYICLYVRVYVGYVCGMHICAFTFLL